MRTGGQTQNLMHTSQALPPKPLSCSLLSHGTLLFTQHRKERSPTVVAYCLRTLVMSHSCLLCSQRLSAEAFSKQKQQSFWLPPSHALADSPGLCGSGDVYFSSTWFTAPGVSTSFFGLSLTQPLLSPPQSIF